MTPESLFFQQEWDGPGHATIYQDASTPDPKPPSEKLADVTRAHVLTVYARSGFNQAETARRLGIARSTLLRHLKDASTEAMPD